MELDDLKAAWESQARALDESMRLNTALHKKVNLQTVERRMGTALNGVVVQLVCDAVAVLLVGSFAGDHAAEARYLIPAIVLGAYAIAIAVATISQIVSIRSLDYGEPVLAIQQRLLRLRAFRIRYTMWTLALAPLMWVPLAIVAVRGIFGVDVYGAFGVPYIAANAAFGAAVLLGAFLVAKRDSTQFSRHPAVKSILDDLSGRSLAQALRSLDSLQRFASM